MTSITWAGPRCVQEPAAILAPQNRTQGRCDVYFSPDIMFKDPSGMGQPRYSVAPQLKSSGQAQFSMPSQYPSYVQPQNGGQLTCAQNSAPPPYSSH